ncbi:MAG: Zn-dependent hydrolase [Acidobacteriota bacterium]
MRRPIGGPGAYNAGMRIHRRTFIQSAAASLVWAGAPSLLIGRAGRPVLDVDAVRLRRDLENLSIFGRTAGGTFADGVSRVAYSEADVAGRAFVMDLMRAAGLDTRVDPAGNIIGRRKGRDPERLPILFGSHIDSVPNGGNFDGDLGSLAAIEAVRVLAARNIVTLHPLEVVVWANEEGYAFGNGLCGSRAAAGELGPGELDFVWQGTRKRDAIRRIGGNPDRIADARRTPGSFHCYLELHIEQGGVLHAAGIPIGVVEGIVAIDRYAVIVTGEPNHAGTTPMGVRRDALRAASMLVIAVHDVVRSEPGRHVGTVGQLTVAPNVPNVVPGTVTHTIELRDLSAGKISTLAVRIRERAESIARDTGTTIAMERTSHHPAAMTDPRIQDAVAAAAARLGLPHQRMPSGAGHDAQMMARLGPMGMIFVPSIDGVSHSPRESTSWDDCARGAAVLVNTLLAMDETPMRS